MIYNQAKKLILWWEEYIFHQDKVANLTIDYNH